ncbi:MAG: hypothetical protein ACKV2Q_15130 [Planctomycetaceae bacterium]
MAEDGGGGAGGAGGAGGGFILAEVDDDDLVLIGHRHVLNRRSVVIAEPHHRTAHADMRASLLSDEMNAVIARRSEFARQDFVFGALLLNFVRHADRAHVLG